MKKTAVIGNPIKHSLSPLIHNYWHKKYNIDCEYEKLELSIDNFEEEFLKLKEDYIGLNVTVPFKEKVINICDEIDEKAEKIGAVNTVLFSNKILGKNTDSYGFRKNIEDFKGKTAKIIGAGGAARAAIYSFKDLEEIYVINRTFNRAENLAQEFGVKAIKWEDRNKIKADILVNTTTLGMEGFDNLDIEIIEDYIYDIVYKPLKTDLLLRAESKNKKIRDGLGMLVYQAALSFSYWHGVMPEYDIELKNKLLAKL